MDLAFKRQRDSAINPVVWTHLLIDRGCLHHVSFEEHVNTLFHFRRKPRHRPHQLLAVYLEHYFFEHRKCSPGARLIGPERTVVVKAYSYSDGDSLGAPRKVRP